MHKHRNSVVQAIHHIALRVSDFEASLRFYTEGLGFALKLQFREEGETVALLDVGNGTYLELFSGAVEPSPKGHFFHLALRTDDCGAALERARAAGATVTIAPTDALLEGGDVLVVRYAFCEGPDGEEIEFLESADL